MARSARPITALRRATDALLIGAVLVVLFGVVLARVVPLTGHQTFVIGGGSMEPAIPLGAAVVTEPVTAPDLAVGDIVSLRTGDGLASIFTHRITRLVPRDDGLWVETKGDANASIDPSITPATQILGRVAVSIPYAGYLIALLSIPSGVLLVMFLAAFLLTLAWLLESYEIDRIRNVPAVGVPAVGAAPDPAQPSPPTIDEQEMLARGAHLRAADARAAEARAARGRRDRRRAAAHGSRAD